MALPGIVATSNKLRKRKPEVPGKPLKKASATTIEGGTHISFTAKGLLTIIGAIFTGTVGVAGLVLSIFFSIHTYMQSQVEENLKLEYGQRELVGTVQQISGSVAEIKHTTDVHTAMLMEASDQAARAALGTELLEGKARVNADPILKRSPPVESTSGESLGP